MSTRRNWSIAGAVAAVIAVGSFVGIYAGQITQRAPRGGGVRIGVVENGALTPGVLEDALARALSATPNITVAPLAELSARRAVLARRNADAGLVDAARALGLSVVADVHVDGARLSFSVIDVSGGNPIEIDGKKATSADTIYAVAGEVAKLLQMGPVPPFTPPSDNPRAYAAFVEGRAADALAIDPTCAPCLLALGTPDALAKAKGSSRLSRKEQLLVDGAIATAAAHAAGSDLAQKDAHVQEALDAYRNLSVELPEEPDGHFHLGATYNRILLAHDEALHHLEAARRLVPNDLTVVREVADAWLHMGDRKHAVQAAKGYLALFPNDDAAKAFVAETETAPLPSSP